MDEDFTCWPGRASAQKHNQFCIRANVFFKSLTSGERERERERERKRERERERENCWRVVGVIGIPTRKADEPSRADVGRISMARFGGQQAADASTSRWWSESQRRDYHNFIVATVGPPSRCLFCVSPPFLFLAARRQSDAGRRYNILVGPPSLKVIRAYPLLSQSVHLSDRQFMMWIQILWRRLFGSNVIYRSYRISRTGLVAPIAVTVSFNLPMPK